ncbi:MAG: RsmE family RNA methyltransferase [Pirellulales bacterium]
MTARYFSAVPIADERVVLEGDEAHHLLHVMRAGPGARVVLFDGSGWEFDAEVKSCQRRTVELDVLSRREVNRELSHRLVMGVALPKGDRQKWLVEKLTELGVTELVPLNTERSVAQPGGAAIERLARTVIEASKQCGRNRLMQISRARTFADFVNSATTGGSVQRIIAHPTGRILTELVHRGGQDIVCTVGPEGGFTDAEHDTALVEGWEAVSLGPRILRIETAAIALAASLAHTE